MRLLSLVFLMLGLVACGGQENSDDPSQSVIDGIWQSDCLPGSEGSYLISPVFAYGNSFQWFESWFSDGQCSEAAFSAEFSGNYELAISGTELSYELDLEVENVYLEPENPDWAQFARQQQVCGLSQWESHVRQSLEGGNGTLCPISTATGYIHRNLIQRRQSTLRIAYGKYLLILRGLNGSTTRR